MPSQKKITSRCPGLGAFTAHVSLLQFPVRCADWYIEQNVVADALSRLDMDEKPSLHEALISKVMCLDWYCYAKEEMTYDSHPLSFQHSAHGKLALSKAFFSWGGG